VPTTPENYLVDLGKEVLALAETAQTGGSDDDFAKGRRSAFYEVLSLMRQQADAFGLDDEAIGLKGVDIEQLLR
jgi:hypothetical protein